MADLIKKLRRNRGPHRTQIVKALGNLLAEQEKDLMDPREISVKISTVEKKTEKLEELNNQILDTLYSLEGENEQDDQRIENDIEKELEECEKIREDTRRAVERAKEILKTPDTGTSESDNCKASSACGKSNSHDVPLPKLQLKPFEGNPLTWERFWDGFRAAVDKNETLEATQKFTYLQTLLKGEAEMAIEGLTLSAENYDAAKEILHNRFGDAEVIKSVYSQRLVHATTVNNSNDIVSLRRLFDTCNSAIRSLDNINKNSNGEDEYKVLLPIVLGKWPLDFITMWEREVKIYDRPRSLTGLMKFLDREIKSREVSIRIKNQSLHQFKEPTKPSVPYGKPQFRKTTTASLHTKVQEKPIEREQQKFCVCCKKTNHEIEYCLHAKKLEPAKILDLLRRNGLCFKCLKKGHMGKSCLNPKHCSRCNKNHPKLLCQREQYPNTSDREVIQQPAESKSVSRTDCLATGVLRKNTDCILLQTVPANIVTENGHTEVIRCLLDTGSQVTFIREDLAQKLNLPIQQLQRINVQTVGGRKHDEGVRHQVQCVIQNIQDSSQFLTLNAVTIPTICSTIQQTQEGPWVSELKNEGIEIYDTKDKKPESKIDLLIGADHYWKVVSGEIRRTKTGPVAVNSILGWLLHGPTNPEQNEESSPLDATIMFLQTETVEDIMKKFWTLESLGIEESGQELEKKKLEERMIEDFEKTVGKDADGRYVVNLPWKDEKKNLLSQNRERAEARLRSTVKSLEKKDTLALYNDVIEDQINNGIVEECVEINKCHYLPHREVIREDHETTKLRVVFDASCKTKDGISLNDCLESGPKLNPDIFEMLIRLRQGRILIMSDIEKAFLQIKLRDSDKDYVRFLWFDNAKSPHRKQQIYRMTRVLFGLTSSPYLLAATIRSHLKQFENQFEDTVSNMRRSIYVDDWVTSVDNEAQAIRLYEEGKTIMAAGKFNLRKWKSNDSEVQALLNERERSQLDNIGEEKKAEKLLGIKWDKNEDLFIFNLSELVGKKTDCTKRNLLSVSASVYDPLGLISPITTSVKLLIQHLWQLGVTWDEPLSEEIATKWEEWEEDLKETSEIKFSRWVNTSPNDCAEIIMFCDASQNAYATACYIKVRKEDGQTTVNLIASKARVAPLKKLSIPRLELMAMVLAVRLSENVKNSLEQDIGLSQKVPVKFYSDSMVTLTWVKGDYKRWKPFVANRVMEIQDKTQSEHWHYCRTEDNPADLPSRGMTSRKLKGNLALWENGPKWLKNNEYEHQPSKIDSNEIEKEMKKAKVCVLATENEKTVQVIDPTRYSKLERLLRVTAYVKRFIANLKLPEGNRKLGEITTEEIKMAEKYWLKEIQEAEFSNEITCLKNGKELPKSSKILNLNPILDDELLKVGGRLHWANIAPSRKHPVIVPGNHHVIKLWIQKTHVDLYHTGVRDTLVALRQQLWIIRGRQVIKKSVKECLNCKKLKATPYNQVLAPLPKDRVAETPAFQITGVDFLGPLYVKNTDNTAGEKKVYVCLLTCAVNRAVHLEMVEDLSTNSFLLALNRFIARRGAPNVIYSDNAKTFKKAKQYIDSIWAQFNDEEIEVFMTTKRISWKHIIEAGPWWGGFWERMVRTVKDHLKRTLQNARLTISELTTAVTQIECIVNSRPLTYTYNELEEPEPITPNLLLTGRLSNAIPTDCQEDLPIPVLQETLTKRVKYREALVDMFWKRWKTEYLQELMKGSNRFKERHEIKVGDICLIEENAPRLRWKLAKVERLFLGADGRIRSAEIKTKNHMLKRPIQKLYSLELCHSTDDLTRPRDPDAEDHDDHNDVHQAVGEGGECVGTSTRLRNIPVKFKDYQLD